MVAPIFLPKGRLSSELSSSEEDEEDEDGSTGAVGRVLGGAMARLRSGLDLVGVKA